MIRSFSRNGLVQRSPCQRTPCIFVGTHVFGRCRGPNLLRRPISTSPEHTSPEPTPPQTPLPNSRKNKPELRPSPVKPPPTLINFHPPPAAPSSAPRLPTSASDSILQNTRYDYEEARKHGILVPPPAGTSRIGALWHQFKEIFKFYVRGIKLIYTHRKRVKAMEARIESGGEPLSRWETRFIHNYRVDSRKLIPFLLILVIVEEIIPLVVIYAPFVLPSTCVLPSQRERILLKQRRKIQQYADVCKSDLRHMLDRTMASESAIPFDKLITKTEHLAMCGILSLSTFPILRLSRISRRLQYIMEDDVLLIREGMNQRLTLPELQEALDERGFVTNDLGREAMQNRLRWWLTCVEKDFTAWDWASRRALLIAQIHAGDAEKHW